MPTRGWPRPERDRRAPPPPAPIAVGDMVKWGASHVGTVLTIQEDGNVLVKSALQNRKWRLPATELRRC